MPAGLGDLSAGLQAVADFFEIDEDLIAAAAVSPSIEEPRGLAEWIATVPAERHRAARWPSCGAAADRKDARVRAAEQREREEEARKAARSQAQLAGAVRQGGLAWMKNSVAGYPACHQGGPAQPRRWGIDVVRTTMMGH